MGSISKYMMLALKALDTQLHHQQQQRSIVCMPV
jgi:hypothetical protein